MHINGLLQDCGISIANSQESLSHWAIDMNFISFFDTNMMQDIQSREEIPAVASEDDLMSPIFLICLKGIFVMKLFPAYLG